jgi:UDP-N-acetyl-D-galactosamine dehydrogenase
VLGGSRVLVLGLTFKENCPDLRNTRVVDVLRALVDYGMRPVVVDGWADPAEALHEYGLSIQCSIPVGEQFAAVIGAVAHNAFTQMTIEQWRQPLSENGVLLDLKGVMPRELSPIRL